MQCQSLETPVYPLFLCSCKKQCRQSYTAHTASTFEDRQAATRLQESYKQREQGGPQEVDFGAEQPAGMVRPCPPDARRVLALLVQRPELAVPASDPGLLLACRSRGSTTPRCPRRGRHCSTPSAA